MSKKWMSIIVIATFFCLMASGVLPVSACSVTLPAARQEPSRMLLLYASQAAVGGECCNDTAPADPVLCQACISIGGTSVLPDSSANWKGCPIQIGMYAFTDGIHFFLKPHDSTTAHRLSYLQSGQRGHCVRTADAAGPDDLRVESVS